MFASVARVAQEARATQNVARAQDGAAKILEQLASGRRVGDVGAASAAIGAQLTALADSAQQGSQNALEGAGMAGAADGAAGQIGEVLAQMRALAVQSANGPTVSDASRAAINESYQALGQEVDRLGAGRVPGSAAAFGDNVQVQVGTGADAANQVAVALPTLDAGSLGIGGSGVASAAAAGTSLGLLDGAIGWLSAQRASLGAAQARLEGASGVAQDQRLADLASASQLTDTDYLAGGRAAAQSLMALAVSTAMVTASRGGGAGGRTAVAGRRTGSATNG